MEKYGKRNGETAGIMFLSQLFEKQPKNIYFTLIFWILKLLGIFIFTHLNINKFSDSGSLAKIIRNVLYFQSRSSSVSANYNIISLSIYVFISLFIIMACVVYHKLNSNKDLETQKNKESLLSILTYGMLAIIVLFSQHIMEILYLGCFNLYINDFYALEHFSSPDPDVINCIIFFTNFNKLLLLNKYIVLALNVFLIFFINIVLYYYLKLANLQFVSVNSSMKYPKNTTFCFTIIIMTNLTGLHFIDLIITNSDTLKIIFLFVSASLSLILIFSFDKYIFKNVSCLLTLTVSIDCILSGLIEFSFYFVSQTSLSTSQNYSLLIMRLVIEFTIAFSVFNKIVTYRITCNKRKAYEVLFRSNKSMPIETLYELLDIMKTSVFNSSKDCQMTKIFALINYHKVRCRDETCSCNLFHEDSFYRGMKEFKNVGCKKSRLRRIKFFEVFFSLIMSIENEIIKSICQLQSRYNENSHELIEFFLMHVDYVMYFKTSPQYALFLKNQYEHYAGKNYLYRYYFSILTSMINKSEEHKSETDSRPELSLKFSLFYHENFLSQKIHQLMKANLESYENLLKIKKSFTEKSIRQFNSENFKEIVKTCIFLYKESNELTNLLIKEFSDRYYKNAEMCFLLYNYFVLINQNIPSEVENLFVHIQNYSDLKSLESSYEDKNMKHPLILKLCDKQFIITFVSQKLCDFLGYKHSNLIGKDFHKLIPDILAEQHFILMKKFLFFENGQVYIKESFIIDFSHNILKVIVHCAVLPGLKENTLVLDIHPLNQEIDDYLSVLILDQEFSLVAFNSNFEENFLFNYEMLKKMDVSITQLFGINDNYLQTNFRDELIEIKNRPTDDMLSLFSPVNLKYVLKENANKTKSELPFDSKFSKTIFVKKKKNAMRVYLQKLQMQIVDNEYPRDWSLRLSELEKVLRKTYKQISKISLRSSCSSPNSDPPKLEVQLRSVGNSAYYLIKSQDSELFDHFSNEFKSKLNKGIYNYIKDKNYDHSIIQENKTLNTNNPNISSGQNLNISVKDGSMINLISHNLNIKRTYFSSTSSDVSSINNFCDNKFRPFARFRNKLKLQDDKMRVGKEFILYILLFLLLSGLTFLSGYNMYYTNKIIATAKNIFLMNYNILQLNSILVFSGLSLIDSCILSGLNKTLNERRLNDIRSRIRNRQQEYNIYVYDMRKYLVETQEVSKEITNILYEKETYSILSDDWKEYSRATTFNDELDYFHYYLANLQNPNMFNDCRISEQGITNNFSNRPYFGEKTTYYYLKNVLKKMKPKAMTILLKSYNILKNYHESAKFNLLIFNLTILLIFVLLAITVMLSINNLNSMIKSLLLNFVKNKKQDELFEKNLNNLKNVLECLDRKVGLLFDDTRQKSKIIPGKFNKISPIAAEKINEESKKTKLLNTKDNETKETRMLNSNSEILKSQEKSITTTLNFGTRINLKEKEETFYPIKDEAPINFKFGFVKCSIIFLFLFMLIYVILIIVTITSNIKDYDNLVFSNRMVANFIQRAPRLAELIVYFKIIVHMRDPYFLKTEMADKKALNEYLDVYLQDTENDSLTIPEEEYDYIYYILKSERNTIKTFMSSYSNLLLTTRQLEKAFDSPDVCYVTALYDQKFIVNKNLSVENGFLVIYQNINNSLKECKNVDNGINLKGYTLVLNHYTTSLNSLYMDFMGYYKSGALDEEKIKMLMDNPILFQLDLNADYSIKNSHNGMMTTLVSDMDESYNFLAEKEYIFSSLKVLLSFTFIIYFILVVLFKLKSNYFLLDKGIERFYKTEKFNQR